MVTLLGILTALALPNIDSGRQRADAVAHQIRAALQTAQRSAVAGQHEVVVSLDTAGRRIRIIEDRNNDRKVQPTDRVRWIGLEDGVRFATPAKRVGGPTGTKAVVNSTTIAADALPSVVFRRDGSASAELEVYLESLGRTRHRRAVTLTKALGRATWHRSTDGITWTPASL